MSEFEDWISEDEEYVLNLPYHLAKAGMADDYCAILTEFDFLQYKVSSIDSQLLIEDYDLRSESNLGISEQMQSSLKSIQGALKLSNNFLAQDSNQLATQLYGRLMFHKANEIQSLLTQIKERQNPWFRLITPSLSTPDGPEIYTLSDHKGAINSVAIFSDGKKAISASSDHTLKVWDLEKGMEIHTLGAVKRSRGSGVMRIMGTEDEEKLKSFIGKVGGFFFGSLDPHDPAIKEIKAIDLTLKDTEVIREYFGRGNSDVTTETRYQFLRILQKLCADPDLEQIIFWFSSNLENSIKEKSPVGHNDEVVSVVVTPDGQHAISGSYDCTVKVWNLETGEEIRTFSGHADWVNSIAVTPDGQRVISASSDKTLKVWDIKTGTEILTFFGHDGSVGSVVVSPDGQRVISSSRLGTTYKEWDLKVWDLATGTEIRTLSGHGTTKVVISPDGKQAVAPCGDQTLKVLDLETGEEKYTISDHGGRYVRDIAFTQNKSKIITADFDSTIKLWDLDTGEVVRTFVGHKSPVNTLAVIPETNQMISGSEDSTFKLWDLNSKVEIPIPSRHQHNVNSIEIIPNKNQAISYSQDDDLKVWDLETGEEICTLMGHRMLPRAFAVSPDGKWVVSGCFYGTLKFWELETRTEIYTLSPHSNNQILALSISPNGKWLVSGSNDKTVRVWDLEKGRNHLELTGHMDHVNILAITPNSKRLISGSSDRTLKVWDLESGNIEFTLIGHNYEIDAVAITPDGKQVISKSYDGVRIWDLNTGLDISSLDHEVHVGKFVVLPDNRWIVFSRLGNLKIWNWQDGKTLASLTWDSLYRFAVTDDAKTIVIGDGLGQVHVLCLEGIENFSVIDSNLSRKQIEIENKNLAIPSNNLLQPYNFLLASVFRHSDISMYEILVSRLFRGHQENENRNVYNSHNLALLYNSLGGYKKVKDIYFQVLEDNKQKLGTEHPSIATILNNISNLYTLQEKYKEAESYYNHAQILKQKSMPLVGISNTKGWTNEQIQTRIAEVKFWLDWDNTIASSNKWWEEFENLNQQRLPLVLRLCEELARRRVTITDFFRAYLDSETDNIQGNLDYLDHTRQKKEEELKKKAAT